MKSTVVDFVIVDNFRIVMAWVTELFAGRELSLAWPFIALILPSVASATGPIEIQKVGWIDVYPGLGLEMILDEELLAPEIIFVPETVGTVSAKISSSELPIATVVSVVWYRESSSELHR